METKPSLKKDILTIKPFIEKLYWHKKIKHSAKISNLPIVLSNFFLYFLLCDLFFNISLCLFSVTVYFYAVSNFSLSLVFSFNFLSAFWCGKEGKIRKGFTY